MPTPHISAPKGAFAKTVLMPGDPLRARWIAEHFLEDVREVTAVRNMLGFTGSYQGRPISVMGSGMGIPSISIYAKELITEYGVEQLIRVGSCGTNAPHLALGDILIGQGASTDSQVNRIRFHNYDLAALADFNLLQQAVACARQHELKVHVGNLFSSDLFYTPDPEFWQLMARYRILGVEMEAAGLYGVAAEYGARALALCCVSDHLGRGERLDAFEREQGFVQMVKLALDSFAGEPALL